MPKKNLTILSAARKKENNKRGRQFSLFLQQQQRSFDSLSIKEGKKFPAQGITAQASVD